MKRYHAKITIQYSCVNYLPLYVRTPYMETKKTCHRVVDLGLVNSFLWRALQQKYVVNTYETLII